MPTFSPQAWQPIVASPESLWLVAAVVAISVLVTIFLSIQVGRRNARRAFEDGLTRDMQKNADERALLLERIELKDKEVYRLSGESQIMREELKSSQQSAEQRGQELALMREERARLETRLEEAERNFAERENLLKETGVRLKNEFQVLAQQIFEEQGKHHTERLSTVLTPLREQMQDFRKRVDEVYSADTKDRATLLAEVRGLQQASERINEETENLTKALKGDKKLQGNWGELVLERILEASGLRKDHEYFLQESRRAEDGSLKRPDVLIRLPDDKDIVIDAKLSLNAYERALAAEDEQERAQQVRTHVANLKNHVRRLSDQDYDNLQGLRSLDFVLMFVPIESAFTLAMEADQKLFTDAFDARIVIVSPTTLMMTLRIIHNVWRYEKQSKNAQEIANRAGALYDKLRVFVEEMDKLGTQIGTVTKTYEGAYARLASGKGNLIRQAERFRELGARVKKPMDPAVVEQALDDEPLGDEEGRFLDHPDS